MVNSGEAISFKEYWEKIREPAVRFAFVVASQAAASFATISMLSHVMEGVAAKLRHDLFDAIQRVRLKNIINNPSLCLLDVSIRREAALFWSFEAASGIY